jgi:uncharacterized protein
MPASAAGPSFDCTAAKAPIEKLICSDADLSQADFDMTRGYKALRQILDAKGRADLLQAQRRWLQSRFVDCKIPVSGEIPAPQVAGLTSCLNGLYGARIKALDEAQSAAKSAANNSSAGNNAAAVGGAPSAASAAPGQPAASQAESVAQPVTTGQSGSQAQLPDGGSAATSGATPASGTAQAVTARLDQTVFTATGRQETLLTVGQFGRYALTTHSGQGTAVQLIDRMAGPGDQFGVPGSSDGRIDTFLDHGVYKVVLQASDKGTGEAELDIHPFAELNAPAIPRLTELKLVQGDLVDFQQRSYWLDITERRTVAIEAAGRNLADLRLWRDGNWLVDATPMVTDSEPEPGKPLNVRRLVTVLEPGLYLLSAYGGPATAWAKTSDAHPFYLRLGIPSISEGGRQVHITSPFGVDRYLIPASANYFRLELPEAEAAGLSVSDYSEASPFAEGDRAVITKKSVPPVAEIEDESKDKGQKLITINREAGKPYLLQHFKSVERYYFKETGNYWLSTLHSGYGDDSIDATPVLTEQFPNQPETIFQAQVPELNAQSRWTRRFNLLETATAYVHVTEAGTYMIETPNAVPNQGNGTGQGGGAVQGNGAGQGAAAANQASATPPANTTTPNAAPGNAVQASAAPANTTAANTPPANGGAVADYRFEPMIQIGLNYQAPDFQPAGQPWKLEPGYYVLTMRPKDKGKGILTVTVRGQAAPADGPDDAGQAKVTSATWPSVSLDDGADYTLYLNRQPGVEAGVVLRSLPVDLAEDLPVNLSRGQSLDVDVRVTAGDSITVVGEDGQPASFAVDHGDDVTAWTATDGAHVVTLENKGDKPVFVTLRETPAALAPETPLPPIGADRLAAIPVFPTLAAEAPTFFDIAKDEKKTFALSIKQPGLYRLESSGLLQTEGAIRTRIILALDRQSNNGIGRNFLIQQYLGEGDYQLTLNTQGRTLGHMGVALSPTVLDDGGPLSLNLPARHSLQAGHGLRYSFTIPAAGQYHLRALGLNRTFTMRLEDADGWPIVKPGIAADFDDTLRAGTYHLVILPQAVDAKVVTLLEAQPVPPTPTGHGPHPLALNQVTSYQWREPEAGQPRLPDGWQFTLPGAAHVSMDLPRGLKATIRNIKSDAAPLPEVNGGDTWAQDLPAGDYQLDVSSRQPNNRLDYTIDIRTDELIAGQRRKVTAPVDVPVSIGSDAIVEIGSFGTRDVRGWLYDADNNLVASNDDRANDWNFAIAGRLKSGKYRLHVDPVGTATAETTVSVYQSEERREPDLQIGADVSLSGLGTHVLSLIMPDDKAATEPGSVLIVSANAPGNVTGLSLEQSDGHGSWQTLGEISEENPWLAAPLAAKSDLHYRLRLWSADRSTAPITLQSRLVVPDVAKQPDFIADAGIKLAPVPGITPPLALAAVGLAAPGSFQLGHAPDHLHWTDSAGQAFRETGTNVVFGRGDRLYFAARLAAGSNPAVAASRLVPSAAGIALSLPDQGNAVVGDTVTVLDNSAGGNKPVLWLAESRLGQPGIAFTDDLAAADTRYFGVSAADQSSVAVTMDEQASPVALEIWNAGHPGKALPVTLRRFDFAAPRRETLDWSVADRALGARQTLALDLPKGSKRLQLALPPETAVLLQAAGQRDQLLWSGNDGLALHEDSAAEHLLLLNAGSAVGHVGISLAPLAAEDTLPALGSGNVVKQYAAASGTSRLALTLSDSERRQIRQGQSFKLHVVGAVRRLTLLSEDGSVREGQELPVSDDGVVDIAHDAGLVVAWLEGGDRLLNGVSDDQAIAARAANVIPLTGNSRRLIFDVPQPKLLHLKTTAPVLAFLPGMGKDDVAQERLRVFANGADISLYLPKGETSIRLQSAAPGNLSGVAEVSMTDIVPIGEGLGPRQRLVPGESRLFSFTLQDERDIGVGVAGSADVAHCRLLDAAGVEIGSGVVQMQHLKAGTYLLAVDMPMDGAAIDVQPALVGIAKPDGSPPDDVKRAYLELAGLKPKQQE